MTVKVYVGRDSEGRPWPPDYSHETLATVDIIKRLWLAFSHQDVPYAVVTNLHCPSADLVLISEHGLGIVELKHYYGRISQQSDGAWYAGPKRIEAGAESRGFRNPHEQVQAYAEQIRDKLIHPVQPPPWLPGRVTDWENFKFQTAVCFTHPDVSIKSLKRALRGHQHSGMREWEEFTIIRPNEVPERAAALRFEICKGYRQGFEPHRLTLQQITRIATRLLGGTEWKEIIKLMPTGEPYIFLALIEQERRVLIFGVDQEEVLLGRNANKCAVPIPQEYTCVGRIHARITRSAQNIFIEDMDSKNGTYVDEYRLRNRERKCLEGCHKITLGGPAPGAKVCLFETSLTRPLDPESTETYLEQH